MELERIGIRKSRERNSQLEAVAAADIREQRRERVAEAYEQGYRLNEIAAYLGVHYATVSRRLKRIEQSS